MTKQYSSKIFLDSGNPEDTKNAIEMLGFLDGQTTNPSLVAKNPAATHIFEGGNKCSREELDKFYLGIIEEIEQINPGKSISIEVYADKDTSVEEIIEQARKYTKWSVYSYVKVPIVPAGLKAAETLAEEMSLNFTLCFTQAQAAAVHSVTKDSPYKHYVSPFIGRLDDKGVDGMSLIKNILQMYGSCKTQVEVLAASIRDLDHIWGGLQLEACNMTIPFKLFPEWQKKDFAGPEEIYEYKSRGETAEYLELDMSKPWSEFNIQHDLTDSGLAKFAEDWNNICKLA